MCPLQIKLFGALEVVHGEQSPQRPATHKVLSLVGYLIVHRGVPQPREKLVDLLWPDLPPRQGRRLFSDTLWRARRLLTATDELETPLLHIAGDTITFLPTPEMWIDVIHFERLADVAGGWRLELRDEEGAFHSSRSNPQAAIINQLQAAIALYRGDFLEECYDDWALLERERLRERYLSLMHCLVQYYQQNRDYQAALHIALRLSHADPLHEETHRSILRLYYLLGREAEALRTYEQFRALLARELHVEPHPSTTALYEEIIALRRSRLSITNFAPEAQQMRAVGVDHASSAALPPPPLLAAALPFVGRHRERVALLQAVERAIAGLGAIMLVAGEAGQGKSQLLREVAAGAVWRGAQVSYGQGRQDAQALPFDPLRGALSSALSPLRVRQLATILDAHALRVLATLLPDLNDILPALALPAVLPPQQAARQFYEVIGHTLVALGSITPQVLILEDIHWFDWATLEALTMLAPHLRTARVLVVMSGRSDELSRRPEVWETLLRLDHSGLLQRVELPGMSLEECAELVQRALEMGHSVPHFAPHLHQATQGNPFFVLETLRSLHEQGLLWRDEHGQWHTPWDQAGAPGRSLPLPAGLRQALAARVRDLSAPDRAALAAAAVLGQAFDPDVWSRMQPFAAGDRPGAGEPSGVPAPSAEELLRRRFLVEEHDGYRFGHETLREVVYGELNEPERQRLHLQAAETLEQEHHARVEALAQHFYLAGAWNKALPYLLQAGERAQAMCAYRDALHRYNQALEAVTRLSVDAADLGMYTTIQLKRGELCVLLGDYEVAVQAYESVVQWSASSVATGTHTLDAGTRHSAQIQALNGLCQVYGLTNNYPAAHAVSRRSLELARQSPRLIDSAEAAYQAGLVSYRVDDYGAAEGQLQQALQLYEALDLYTGQARCLNTLAWIWLRRDGVMDRVLESFERALSIYRALGDQYHERDNLMSLGYAYLLRGMFQRVLECCDTILPFLRTADAREGMSRCRYLQGVALHRMGRLQEALETLGEALVLCQELGLTVATRVVQMSLGQVLQALGCFDEAERVLEAARATEDSLVKSWVLAALAELWLERADQRRAFDFACEALRLTHRIGSQPYLGRTLRVLGRIRASDTRHRLPPPDERVPAAEDCFRESITLLEQACYESDLGMTLAYYGEWLLAQGRVAEAGAALQRAEGLLVTCGMQPVLERVQGVLQHLRHTADPLPGQRRVRLARLGAPRGRPLRVEETVEVLWTLEAKEDECALRQGGKTAQRQARLRRLCAEAQAQEAEPTVTDLAAALGVTVRTVNRDLAALRAAGERIVTRGAVG